MTANPLISALLLCFTPLAAFSSSIDKLPAFLEETEDLVENAPSQEVDPRILRINIINTAMKRDTISLDFPEEDIRTVLRCIADLYELNLVIPMELEERTSIKLQDVSWKEAYDLILEPIGYTYIIRGNMVEVIPFDEEHLEIIKSMVTQIQYNRMRLLIHTEILKALSAHPEKAIAPEFVELSNIPNDPSNKAIETELQLLAFLKDMEIMETAEWVATLLEE